MKIAAFTKTYEGRRVLDFPGIELEKGKIYCVIGANGSGKSTFAKVLSSVLPADRSGRILDAGASVGYMPQKNYGFRMSVRSNLMLGSRNTARAEELMRFLQLDQLASKRADRLSGGETARMALARLMMRSYDLVILDEPTAAMDVETTSIAEELIRRCVAESNCALLLVTHSLRQAQRLGDEILFFSGGKLIESGPKEKLLNNPERAETLQFLDFYGA